MASVEPDGDPAAEDDLVVVDATGEIDFDYPLCGLEAGEELIPLVRVAIIGDRLLVAVPLSAWHRKLNKRVLPRACLQKPVVVEVGSCSSEDREAELERPLCRCWMGFLVEEFHASVLTPADAEEFTHVFVAGELPGLLPSARGLVAAAQEHFAFETAAEEEVRENVSGSATIEARMTSLEETLGQIASQLATLTTGSASPTSANTVRASSKQKARPSALKTAKSQQSKFPSLDPSVVAAAIDAGVPEDNLQEMEKLLSGGQMVGKKHAEPRVKLKLQPKKKSQKDRDPLSESESMEEEAGQGEGDSGEAGGTVQSEQSTIAQLAEIVTLLTAEKVRKSKGSRVELALDNMSASGVTDSGTLGSGKKAAAARRVLRQALQDSPEELSNLIERAMLEDLTGRTLVPGLPAHTLCARAWVEHRSRIGHWKTSAYTAWAAAGALDSLIQGKPQAARARLCLLILMLDQTACDRGSWLLSSELALENGPPMAVLAQHQPPATSEGEQPFSRLLDARWAEIAMAHVRETEEYILRRSRLGKKDQTDPPDAAPRAKQKQSQRLLGASSHHQEMHEYEWAG